MWIVLNNASVLNFIKHKCLLSNAYFSRKDAKEQRRKVHHILSAWFSFAPLREKTKIQLTIAFYEIANNETCARSF